MTVGVLVLVNSDSKQLAADIAEVREMEQTGLFEFETKGTSSAVRTRIDSYGGA